MLLKSIMELLGAEVFACEDLLDTDILNACSSDLMSDVLAFSLDKGILLTGLMNQQVIRTAEMMDSHGVIFVRGKTPTQDIIDLAEEKKIVLLATKYSLFTASGILYKNGLEGEIKSYED